MAMSGGDPIAIMKAMGHTGIKTTMIYTSLGKRHIREQVEWIRQTNFTWNAAPVFGLTNYLRTSRRYCTIRYKCRLLWFQHTLGCAPNNPYEW